MTGRNWIELLLLGAVWGAGFLFSRIALDTIHPFTLVFIRVLLACAVLALYLAFSGRFVLPSRQVAAQLAVLALLNNVIPFTLIFTGQTALGAGIASVVNATTPFWTAIAASILTTDEKFSANKLAGIGLGIVGASLIIGPSALAGTGGPAWAKVAILCGTLSYAFAAIYARRFKALGATVVATGQLAASSIMMAPVMLLFGHPETLLHVTGPVWAAVGALAVFSTAIAYILYFRLIASAGATNASLVTLVIPAFALLLGAVFLDETLETFELAGIALIATGLVTIDGRLLARRYRS